ncbi:ATPase family AAA domain-containing protein 5 [Anolis carolinensis]|uniref:ATPase family AAA domain-containing protein 5 n=1 Tax=Anolis carolinensis TaxID=28377 RepID=UPI002F2B6D06
MAVAASSADGDVQPCKKQKEDDPSMKSITKYFPPLGKNVHSVASPPKPNNIMDYFKKSSPTNEKIVSPVTEKESKTTCLSLETSSKSSSRLKRRGKRCRLMNTLNDVKTSDFLIEFNSDNNIDILSSEEKDSKTSPISPSIPTLLDLTNTEETFNACSKNPSNIFSFKNQERKIKTEGDVIKSNVKTSKKRKHKDESDSSECFVTETQQKDLSKIADDKQVASIRECDKSPLVKIQAHDTSAHETPHLNDNTVTVSFEDFLKSQGENEDHIPKTQTSDDPIACDEAVSCQDVQELSLKKVTVLAQIHSVPPKSLSSQKIASIFLKQKSKKAKRQSTLPASEGEGTEQMTLKRKSNVVIGEEELELAILETSGSEGVKSKCTAEERYQFMKAFKQPESEAIKTAAKKGTSKQKEVEETSSKHKLEMEECEDAFNKRLENESSVFNANINFHDKDSRSDIHRVKANKLRRKNKVLKTKGEVLDMNSNQKSEACSQIKAGTSIDAQNKLPQKNNGLRRSPRQKKDTNSILCTPEKAGIAEALTENTSPAIPLQASTPKTNNDMFDKSDLYKAEVITEPFDSKSPIRMKFTRISVTERCMQQSIKMNTTSSNITKAKKLVEKAKVLQHHRKTRTVEDILHTPLRRSTRQQAIADRKRSHNLEDSVIDLDLCTNITSTVVGSVDRKKKHRNLNDVLGKKARNVKATKKSSGKEKMSSLVRKKIKRPMDETIAILDESSEDDSENSQDDKQFRAKRNFLMSGLPESLKRQIAKKAAALEACSLANSCFQTVVHVQQKDEGRLMWRLALPSCPLLTNLREVYLDVADVTKLTFSLGDFSILNTQPHNTKFPTALLSGWRPALTDAQKNYLLEEIQFFNTHFPVKQFFDLMMKKQAASDNNKQVNKCEAVSSDTNIKSDNRREAKRKRKTEDRKSKRRKPIEKTEADLPNNVCKVSNVKQAGMENTIHIIDTHEESEIITIEDSDSGSEIRPASDFTHEDTLWTEKYQPQNSSELIGNTVAIKKLHRWLCEWKRRVDWEENRTQKEEDGTHQESSDIVDFQDDRSDSEDEAVLCNTMLLIGPPGIGKTAAVYACAQELGFKIFEVNASCQRSGRQILSHLKEATQSHQVDKQGVHAHKAAFFNSYSTSKSPKKGSPRKEWSPRKLTISPRKGGLKQGLAPRTLANYFKISSKSQNKEEKKAQGDNKENKKILPGENTQVKSVKREAKEEESSKKCATSLILFEEVDIIFDEDVGFLNAIKTFMTTTKRPVILTTNDPSFSLIFDGCFEEITFTAPSLINVASYLQVLCLAENLRTDIKDFTALLTSNNCDIRQSVLHLQFWVKSGGGYLKEKRMATHGKEASDTEQGASVKEPTKIPKYDTGCIENLLGLTNIFLPSEDLLSFLKHEITTKEEWNKLIHLLTEFQRKDIDFIYNNLENILPLPVNIFPETMLVPPLSCENFTKNTSNNRPIDSQSLGETSPVEKAKQTKRRKKNVILDDSDLFESELNYSGFITVPSDTTTSCLEENPKFKSAAALNDQTIAKPKGSALTFQCLGSLTEFVDNMSFSDCCFSRRTQESTQSCKYEEFIWTKGKIKNGLSDEFSLEDTDWWRSQSSIELKATMEALNFNKCLKNVSKIMENALNTARTCGKNDSEELSLHFSKDQSNLYFGQSAANSRIHDNAQKRLELIKTVFSGRTQFNFSNRQASVMEYLPTLRTICKSEKQKEQGKTKRRFLHYLEGIHLTKEILTSLTADFP